MKTPGDVALKSDIAVIPTPAYFSISFLAFSLPSPSSDLKKELKPKRRRRPRKRHSKNEFVLLSRSIRQMLTIFSGVEF